MNPYEVPRENSPPPKLKSANGKQPTSSGLHVALAIQIVALLITLGNWVMSEMSPWGGQIQRYAWNAIYAGVVTGIMALGLIIAAYRQQKSRWLFFEVLLLLFLIVCALARLT
jgi:hypothetical protein